MREMRLVIILSIPHWFPCSDVSTILTVSRQYLLWFYNHSDQCVWLPRPIQVNKSYKWLTSLWPLSHHQFNQKCDQYKHSKRAKNASVNEMERVEESVDLTPSGLKGITSKSHWMACIIQTDVQFFSAVKKYNNLVTAFFFQTLLQEGVQDI